MSYTTDMASFPRPRSIDIEKRNISHTVIADGQPGSCIMADEHCGRVALKFHLERTRGPFYPKRPVMMINRTSIMLAAQITANIKRHVTRTCRM